MAEAAEIKVEKPVDTPDGEVKESEIDSKKEGAVEETPAVPPKTEKPKENVAKKAPAKKPMGSVGAPTKKAAQQGGMAAAKSKFETGGGASPGSKPSWKKGASGGAMSGAAAIKDAMLTWCQQRTRGYEGVEVTNFSSSWANGMAFCAIVHSFKPDCLDYASLNPKARRKNFDLAFKVADEVLGAAPLLDTDDMIAMGNKPDWKCVFTYVQSLYRHGQIYEKQRKAENEGETKKTETAETNIAEEEEKKKEE